MPSTVTVACKMPHGLVLRVFDMVEVQEPLPGGGTKPVPKAQPRPQTVTLKGYLEKYNPELPPAARGSSFALTHGVDKEFFETWLKQNQDLDLVRNNLVFAMKRVDKAKLREFEKQRSGLEPVDRARLPKGITPFKKEEAA